MRVVVFAPGVYVVPDCILKSPFTETFCPLALNVGVFPVVIVKLLYTTKGCAETGELIPVMLTACEESVAVPVPAPDFKIFKL